MAQKNTPLMNLLAGEDRILWDAVRRSVIALHPQSDDKEDTLSYEKEFKQAMSSSALVHKPLKKQQSPLEPRQIKNSIHPFDKPTYKKISKGRIIIDARVDLHGMKQDEAHRLLLYFLQTAQHRGLRHVLVITGKGRSLGSEGVLRQSVPHWLSTALFRLYVIAFEGAARHHGGQGALYIRIRPSNGGINKS